MLSSPLTFGPNLKVQRANQHLEELIALTNPLSRSLYQLTMEGTIVPPYREPTEYAVVYRPLKPIPETLSLVIGDIIHNFRSALDHLATNIIRQIDPTAKPYFPANPKRENLVNSGSLALIESALPGAKNLVLEIIRPEHSTSDRLWAFSSLDIDDKHNFIIPSVGVTKIQASNIETPGFSIGRFMASFDARHKHYILGSPSPIPFNEDYQASVSVKFGKGLPFEDEPVVPTLSQIGDLVADTIKAFDQLLIERSRRGG